jgi:hypothetical protein
VTIFGRNFPFGGNFVVMCGSIYVHASYVNITAIQFTSPPVVDATELNILLSIGGGVFKRTLGTYIVTGEYIYFLLQCRASNFKSIANGPVILFCFAVMPTITSIFPARGASTGDTRVTVLGYDFQSTIHCRFGSTLVTTVYVSSEIIYCNSPTVELSGTVSVEVTNDNVHFTNQKHLFEYQYGKFAVLSHGCI